MGELAHAWKCPSATVWQEVCLGEANSNAYRLQYPQAQHQLLATGAAQGWLVLSTLVQVRS